MFIDWNFVDSDCSDSKIVRLLDHDCMHVPLSDPVECRGRGQLLTAEYRYVKTGSDMPLSLAAV